MIMQYYRVIVEEYSGYDCSGHDVPYIVAANNEAEAVIHMMVEKKIDKWDKRPTAEPFSLPEISPRKRKPFIV